MIRQVDFSEKNEWNAFVENHPQGQIGHLLEWSEILRTTYQIPTFNFLYAPTDNIEGVCQLAFQKSLFFGKNLISFPFLNYSGILSKSKDAQEALYEHCLKLAKKSKANYLEFRHLEKELDKNDFQSHKVTFLLSLPNTSDLLWKQLKDKVRNQIRKAEKEKLTFKELNDVGDFYKLYSRNMHSLGSPALTESYFKNSFNSFKNKARLYGVYFEDRLVASGFTLENKNKMEIPWAASDSRFYQKNINIYLYWKIIEEACHRKIKIFDFGRCSKESGTYHFKKQWGGEERTLYWYYWSESPKYVPQMTHADSFLRKCLTQTWKKLPLTVANKLNAKIIKNLPV